MPPLAVIRAPIDMTSAVIVTVPVPVLSVPEPLFVNMPVVAILQTIAIFLPVPELSNEPVTVHEPPYVVRLYGRLEIAPMVTKPVPLVTVPIVTMPVEDKLLSIAVER